MHDIKFIRENPEAFDAGLARRGIGPQSSSILKADAHQLRAQQEFDLLKSQANANNAAIGIAAKSGDDQQAYVLKAEGAKYKVKLNNAQLKRSSKAKRDVLLATLPNLPDAGVPEGADEAGNVEVSRWGTPRAFAFSPKEHADLGPALGLDFETGALLSGSRFTFLRGQMARLQRAIGQFMLDTQTLQRGYIECATPLLVREEALFGTGQLPKFAEDNFQTTDGRWLISSTFSN